VGLIYQAPTEERIFLATELGSSNPSHFSKSIGLINYPHKMEENRFIKT